MCFAKYVPNYVLWMQGGDPLAPSLRLMSLQLLFDEHDRIDSPLDDARLDAWRMQFDRATQARDTRVLSERLAVCFAEAFAQCLDPDLRPPSGKQIQYPTAIARALNVDIAG